LSGGQHAENRAQHLGRTTQVWDAVVTQEPKNRQNV